MSFVHWLVVLSALVSISGSSYYIRDTYLGKNKPNRVSWLMWALAPLIGTMAALSSGADPWSTVRIFLAGLLPLIIFITSFLNKNSYWKLTTFDFLCGACSMVAIIFWLFVSLPTVAILLAAIGDGFASLPTIVKAWRFPETETGITYLGAFTATLLVLPSIPVWNIENSAFQIYLLISCALIIIAVYRKRILRAISF